MKHIPLLKDKHILLGVTGGISAYKVCTLASRLTQAGAQVDVVMTESATRFVAPLTFEALTGRPTYTDMWRTSGEALPTHISHVGLAHAAHLLVIAPATANTLAKLATGLADNLLATLAIEDPLLSIAKNLEEFALKDAYFIDHNLYPNVDFYSGIVLRAMGIPTNMFTVMFAIGRLPGWIAQWKESMDDPNWKLSRPRQIYTGPVQTDYVPIDER